MPSPHFLIDGIDCTINFGPDGTAEGIEESWPETGPIADIAYQCYWEDRYYLANALMGRAAIVNGVVVRTPPHRFLTNDRLYCKSLGTIRRWGLGVNQSPDFNGPAGWPYGEFAIIPAHYETLRYSPSGEPSFDLSGQSWTTTRFRISGDVFTPPNGVFKYTSRVQLPAVAPGTSAGTAVADSLLGIVRAQNEISMTRHRVPAGFSLAGIMEFIGTVNLFPVWFGDQEFIAGHLLFAGFNATEQFNSFGFPEYEIEYGLLGRKDYGWNTIMGPDSKWYIINTDAGAITNTDGKYPFDYSDFALVP